MDKPIVMSWNFSIWWLVNWQKVDKSMLSNYPNWKCGQEA